MDSAPQPATDSANPPSGSLPKQAASQGAAPAYIGSLFDDPIQVAFLKFHRENPHVYRMLVKFARQVKDSGRRRYGIKSLFERLRWHYDFEVKSETDFKLNNNFTSRFARLLMEQEPDLEGVFETRKLRKI
jgi:hypothetical protein